MVFTKGRKWGFFYLLGLVEDNKIQTLRNASSWISAECCQFCNTNMPATDSSPSRPTVGSHQQHRSHQLRGGWGGKSPYPFAVGSFMDVLAWKEVQ